MLSSRMRLSSRSAMGTSPDLTRWASTRTPCRARCRAMSAPGSSPCCLSPESGFAESVTTCSAPLSRGSASATARAASRPASQATSTRCPMLGYVPTRGTTRTGRPLARTTCSARSLAVPYPACSRPPWPMTARSACRLKSETAFTGSPSAVCHSFGTPAAFANRSNFSRTRPRTSSAICRCLSSSSSRNPLGIPTGAYWGRSACCWTINPSTWASCRAASLRATFTCSSHLGVSSVTTRMSL